jgi:hypothetical protein
MPQPNVLAEFPNPNRRTIREHTNPLDKSTVVSIYPKAVHEIKRTIQPGEFFIEPGSMENPSILHVGPSSWWREIDDEQPLIEIPVSSVQIAESIVRDYCNGLLACDMQDRMPGLFFVPGKYDVEGIKKEFSHVLTVYERKQRNWYSLLVQMADSLWARSGGNPGVIGDDMRMAAIQLNLRDKEWMSEFKQMELSRCPACGSMINPAFPVCATCRAIINPDKAKALNIKFAAQ